MVSPAIALLCWSFLTRHACARDVFTVGAFLRLPAGRRQSLEQRATAVSEPDSTSYGKYLTQAELTNAIGVPPGAAERVAAWLASALQGTSPPKVLAHHDAVTASAANFSVTYLLGARLQNASAGTQKVNVTSPPPDELELVVTPSAPSNFCKRRTSAGRSTCLASPFCRWVQKAHSPKGKCKGSFAGWICWPGAEWQCYEPSELTVNNTTLPRTRRRGRMVEVDSGAPARLGKMAGERGRGKPIKRQPTLGFSVFPRSEGLTLLEKTSNKESTGWHSVEFSFRQDGLYRTQVLPRTDFTATSDHLSVKVLGIRNLRPVDKMVVCLNENPDHALLDPMHHVRLSESPDCDCDVSLGTDRKQRKCQVLAGDAPEKAPIDFVLPRAPQTLSALQRDLGIPRGLRVTHAGATQAVGEFEEEAFLQDDVDKVHRSFGLRPPTANISIVGPDGEPGTRDDFSTAGEGSLDVQIITTLAPGSPTSWVAVDPYCMDGFILAYASMLNDHARPPLVHSISWGDAEAVYPPAFVRRLDYELMKLALRGLTILIASGDNGNSCSTTACAFVPDVAGSSPWVTTVGATQPSRAAAPYCAADGLTRTGACDEPGPVTCATDAGAIITSSGYWSLYRDRPQYQDLAVTAYLHTAPCNPCKTGKGSKVPVPCQHLNFSGCELQPGTSRGSPDVALPGNSFPVLVNGSVYQVDGTSASAPAFAALVSLLNSQQLSRGRPPLGLLNPWLYRTYAAHPEAFIDVVVGSTASTETRRCAEGWEATPGWDLASGLGVPVYTTLQQLLPASHATEVGSSGSEQLGSVQAGENPLVFEAFHAALLQSATGNIVLILVVVLLLRRVCCLLEDRAAQRQVQREYFTQPMVGQACLAGETFERYCRGLHLYGAGDGLGRSLLSA